MSAAVATSAVLPDPAAPTRVTIPPKPSAALCKSMSNSPSSADRPARPMSGSVRRGARGLQFQVGEFGLPQPGSLRGQQWYGRDLLPYKDTGGLYKGRLEVDYRIVRERTVLSPRPHSRRLFRSWSGDPTPAPLTGFPAGDGGVLAECLAPDCSMSMRLARPAFPTASLCSLITYKTLCSSRVFPHPIWHATH